MKVYAVYLLVMLPFLSARQHNRAQKSDAEVVLTSEETSPIPPRKTDSGYDTSY